jgi:hypothetical protein
VLEVFKGLSMFKRILIWRMLEINQDPVHGLNPWLYLGIPAPCDISTPKTRVFI